MNRRSFLKRVGVVSLLGFSNISFAKNKKELKWISLLDEQPKVGQKIIIGDRVLRSYLCSGTVNSPCKQHKWSDDYVIIRLNRDIARRKHNQRDEWIYSVLSTEGHKILKTKKWLGYHEKPSYVQDYINVETMIRGSKYEGTTYYKRYHYWIPIEGEYPDEIPNFPSIIYQHNKNL